MTLNDPERLFNQIATKCSADAQFFLVG